MIRFRQLGNDVAAVGAMALLATPLLAFAPVTGQEASSVLGQPDFTTRTGGTSLANLNVPHGSAIDPTTGKVFVIDTENHRILRFASAAVLGSGASAESVLGTGVAGCTQNQLGYPYGAYVDGAGRLWVADSLNNRVLRFDDASNAPSAANANGVLGQTGFTSCAFAVTRSRMNAPIGITGSASGDLWISDQGNSRVLRFANAAAQPPGPNASIVLGQLDFTTKLLATSASRMRYPAHIHLDATDHLWVADQGNHRVLRFDGASLRTTGAAANGVLGQVNFITRSTAPLSASSMASPGGVTTDAAGRLFVADRNNHRVLSFDAAATLPNGSAANAVLGQTSFTTGAPGLSATQLSLPDDVVWTSDPEALLVVDFGNNRVLRFVPPP